MTGEQSRSIHEVVYRSIRSRIMLGEIEPGKNYSIRSLAAEFAVSMTPIREATRRLVSEGALAMSSSGRISVPRISSARFKELISIRLLLEPELAVRAIPRIHTALIDRLSEMNNLINETIKAGNSTNYFKTNIDFRRILYLRAQSPVMFSLLETVWLQSGPTLKMAFKKNFGILNIVNQHQIILALKAGNEKELVRSIKDEINSNLSILF